MKIDHKYIILISVSTENPNTLIGTKHGDIARRFFQITDQGAFIKIDDSILTINKSYFDAMFGKIIESIGREEFNKRFIFDGSLHIKEKIKGLVRRKKISEHMNLKKER